MINLIKIIGSKLFHERMALVCDFEEDRHHCFLLVVVDEIRSIYQIMKDLHFHVEVFVIESVLRGSIKSNLISFISIGTFTFQIHNLDFTNIVIMQSQSAVDLLESSVFNCIVVEFYLKVTELHIL